MKKVLLFAVAGLALLFTSCNREQIEQAQIGDEQLVIFHASCSDWSPETKTIRQPDGKVIWAANEKIGVFQGNNSPEGGYVFYSQNTEPQATAVFSGTMPAGSGDYWAIYPYSEYTWLYGSDMIISTFTDKQKGTAGTFANDLYVAVARSATTDLVFSHPFGGIKFSVVSSGVKRAVLIANSGESIACDQMAIQHDGTQANVIDINNGFDTIYLTPEEGTFVPGEAYHIVTLPVTMSNGFTLIFEKTDGSVLRRNVSTGVTVSRAAFRTLMKADEGYQYTKPAMTFSPDAVSVGAKGGSFSITVNYTGEYHIDASTCDWITETGVEGVGYGSFCHSFTVSANTGAERYGVITVCDESNCYPMVVTQADGTNVKTVAHHSLGMRFTATWCGYCPIMNESFSLAKQQLGDRFEIVNFHASSSSLPFSGTNALLGQYQVQGYPTGIVDGRVQIQNYSPSYASQLIINAVDQTEANYPACSSVGLSSTVNGRIVDAAVSVFVCDPGQYKLTVLLLEDGIVASQADYTNGTQSSYVHNNTARMVMNSSISGDSFTVPTANHTEAFNYSVTVPDGYNINNMKILAYIQAQFGSQAVIQSGDYGDWYIDNCRVASLGSSVQPEVQ